MAAEIKKNSKLFTGIKGAGIIYHCGQCLHKIAVCVTVFKIYDILLFAKIKDASRISEKPQFFRGLTGVVLSTQRVQNLPKIAVSLILLRFSSLTTFSTPAKIQDGS